MSPLLSCLCCSVSEEIAKVLQQTHENCKDLWRLPKTRHEGAVKTVVTRNLLQAAEVDKAIGPAEVTDTTIFHKVPLNNPGLIAQLGERGTEEFHLPRSGVRSTFEPSFCRSVPSVFDRGLIRGPLHDNLMNICEGV